MAKIKKIYDDKLSPENPVEIYPITSTQAVYNTENVTIDALIAEGYRFGGLVEPTDSPALSDTNQRAFYFATKDGIYPNFGNQTVEDGRMSIFLWNGSAWGKQSLAVGSANIAGYKVLASVNDLPRQATNLGYLIEDTTLPEGVENQFLYVWVGEGGDTLEGMYQNCGQLRGASAYEVARDNGYEGTQEEWLNDPVNGIKGVGISKWELSQSTADSGVSTITVTLNTGDVETFDVYNGKGIASVEVVGSESSADSATNTYRVTYSDGNHFDFHTKNGKGIASIAIVGSYSDADGATNTYRVTYSDGNHFDFNVKNGNKGDSGYSGAAGELEVVNSLNSTDATAALSAAQGKVLKDLHDTDKNIVNVNDLNGTPTTPYNNADAARIAVSSLSGLRITGQIITYLLADGWHTEQFIGSDVSNWTTASNWLPIAPITVTQNTETGHDKITIGGVDYETASVEDVSQLGQDLILDIGKEINNKTLSDFSNIIWDGTKFVNSNATYNAYVVPIAVGQTLSFNSVSGTLFSAYIFDVKPEKNVVASPIADIKTIGTYSNGQVSVVYYMLTYKDYETTPPTCSVTLSWYGMAKEVGIVKENLSEYRKEYTAADYVNLTWDGTKIVSGNASFDGFLIPLVPGANYNISSFFRAYTFSQVPVLNSSNGYLRRISVFPFIPTQNEKYLLVTLYLSTTTTLTLWYQSANMSEAKSSLPKGRFVCFGDSNTEFKEKDGVNEENLTWSDELERLSGQIVICAGIGGTRYAGRTTVVTNPTNATQAYAALDIVNLVKAWIDDDWTAVDNAVEYIRINEGDDNRAIIARLKANTLNNTDCVILMAGANDFGAGVSVGQKGIIDNTTICGSLSKIISTLMTAKPSLKVYILGNIVKWFGVDSTLQSYIPENFSDTYSIEIDGENKTLVDINEAIKETARYYHIPFCDMYWNLGWNMLNFQKYFGTPGVDYYSNGAHPWYGGGYRLMAKHILGFLQNN